MLSEFSNGNPWHRELDIVSILEEQIQMKTFEDWRSVICLVSQLVQGCCMLKHTIRIRACRLAARSSGARVGRNGISPLRDLARDETRHNSKDLRIEVCA
jgi:hypothetical protein